MNDLETLEQMVLKEFPEAKTKIDAPMNMDGLWVLDVRHGGKWFVVQWNRDKGFGFSDCSNPENILSTSRPDEVYPDSRSVLTRMRELLSQSR